MMRFQNNNVISPSGRPMSMEQEAWEGEINNGMGAGGETRTPRYPQHMESPAVSGGTLPMGQQAGRPIESGNQLDLRNRLSVEVIDAPISAEEARLGSLKAMLSRNVGNYIVASFLVGTQNMVSWEGVLYDVGNDYLTIYQASRDRYIVSDYYSLKFIEFYDTERRELCNTILRENGWNQTGS